MVHRQFQVMSWELKADRMAWEVHKVGVMLLCNIFIKRPESRHIFSRSFKFHLFSFWRDLFRYQ